MADLFTSSLAGFSSGPLRLAMNKSGAAIRDDAAEGGAACPEAAGTRVGTSKRVGDNALHLSRSSLRNLKSASGATKNSSVWSGVAVGWHWLRARPRLAIFFTCSLVPFLIVMAGNYLFPIYVTQTLQASAVYFAGGEITFALGAVVAGFMLPRLIGQHSAANTIPGTMLIFLAGLVVLIVFQFPFAFLVAGALLGFGNAGCRVARNALLLHLVPNDVMGRVGGFYQVLDRVLRTLLVMAMGVVDTHGPPAGYMILTLVLLVALFGVLQSRNSVRVSAVTVPATA